MHTSTATLAAAVLAGDVRAAADATRRLTERDCLGDERTLLLAALGAVLVDAPAPPPPPAVLADNATGERKAKPKARPRPMRSLFTKALCEAVLAGDKEAKREAKLRVKHQHTLQPQNRRLLKAALAEVKARKVRGAPAPAPAPVAPAPAREVKHRSAAAAFADRVVRLSEGNVKAKIKAHALAKAEGWTLEDVQSFSDEDVLVLNELAG